MLYEVTNVFTTGKPQNSCTSTNFNYRGTKTDHSTISLLYQLSHGDRSPAGFEPATHESSK